MGGTPNNDSGRYPAGESPTPMKISGGCAPASVPLKDRLLAPGVAPVTLALIRLNCPGSWSAMETLALLNEVLVAVMTQVVTASFCTLAGLHVFCSVTDGCRRTKEMGKCNCNRPSS